MSNDPEEILQYAMPEFHSSSLMVNVDYIDLVREVGETKAWMILGQLKDLLG